MFKNFLKVFVIFFALTSLWGCQGQMNKQGAGTVIGGTAGGLLAYATLGKGSGKVAATAIGALAGALIGGSIGQNLDAYDKAMMEKSSHQALEYGPSGRSVEWTNPDTGHSGSVTPMKAYKRQDGMYCREYVQEVMIGGEKKKAYGKACRQPDGSWQIVQ